MRSDKTTLKNRVLEVLRLRLSGAQMHDLLQFAAEQGWDVKERQLRYYSAAADKMLARTLEPQVKALMAMHIAMRRAIFARCMGVADYSAALAVLKDEADLLGLYPPTQSRTFVSGTIKTVPSDEKGGS